mmetsp:Transcript_16957/g.33945  ORF Transcript_16957/g.33945 Transcript_16957/m.33945 type:complete len:265 (+) Transcript_16957:17-811(+)
MSFALKVATNQRAGSLAAFLALELLEEMVHLLHVLLELVEQLRVPQRNRTRRVHIPPNIDGIACWPPPAVEPCAAVGPSGARRALWPCLAPVADHPLRARVARVALGATGTGGAGRAGFLLDEGEGDGELIQAAVERLPVGLLVLAGLGHLLEAGVVARGYSAGLCEQPLLLLGELGAEALDEHLEPLLHDAVLVLVALVQPRHTVLLHLDLLVRRNHVLLRLQRLRHRLLRNASGRVAVPHWPFTLGPLSLLLLLLQGLRRAW